MTTRIFSLVVSCVFVSLTLFYRGVLLDMAQRASGAGDGVGHVFSLGAGFGIVLASSIFLTVLAVKSLISYLIGK